MAGPHLLHRKKDDEKRQGRNAKKGKGEDAHRRKKKKKKNLCESWQVKHEGRAELDVKGEADGEHRRARDGGPSCGGKTASVSGWETGERRWHFDARRDTGREREEGGKGDGEGSGNAKARKRKEVRTKRERDNSGE